LAKHIFLVTQPEKLEATVRTAFEIARTGRPGPVVIDIPKDVQNWQGTFQGTGLLPIPGYRQRMHAVVDNTLSDTDCARFFDLLQQSSRPLLYCGGGVINGEAAASLRAFASHFRIPVTTTLMGIGACDTRDELSLKMLGMHGTAYANYAVEDCDLLIAVGARFDDRVAGVPAKFAPRARAIAQFDVDPSEIGKVKPVDWHHVGILDRDLKKMLDYGQARGISLELGDWHAALAELKQTYALNYDRQSELIQPYAVIEAINRHTKGHAIITTGVGQHQMWAAQYFDFAEPRLWLTSGSMGTMGFGLPAAIGAQFARPDTLVIDVDGDASIRMNLGELETVTTYNLPVKVLVLNNYGDGMVKQWQKLFYAGRLSASDKSLRRKDFIKAAQADGFAYAVRLEHNADMEAAIRDWLDFPGPAFLEVIIDRDAGVYPMVGPGLAYDAMITGEHIPSRNNSAGDTDVDGSSMF
jgi:acetolactate synthase-1/2/3 large subunit